MIMITVVWADHSTERPIPQDCKWSSWVEHGCSATCGKEVMRTKERRKLQEASNGGRNCKGATVFITPCNLSECENVGNMGKKILLITLP